MAYRYIAAANRQYGRTDRYYVVSKRNTGPATRVAGLLLPCRPVFTDRRGPALSGRIIELPDNGVWALS